MTGKPQRWIIIPHWDRYQHYKNRAPKWIKDHRDQYDQEEFRNLTFHQRGVLQGLRHSYAASNGQITDSTLALTRRLGQRVATRDLEALNHAGYITFSASKPLALRYHDASLEEETETEEEKRRDEKQKHDVTPLDTKHQNGGYPHPHELAPLDFLTTLEETPQ